MNSRYDMEVFCSLSVVAAAYGAQKKYSYCLSDHLHRSSLLASAMNSCKLSQKNVFLTFYGYRSLLFVSRWYALLEAISLVSHTLP